MAFSAKPSSTSSQQDDRSSANATSGNNGQHVEPSPLRSDPPDFAGQSNRQNVGFRGPIQSGPQPSSRGDPNESQFRGSCNLPRPTSQHCLNLPPLSNDSSGLFQFGANSIRDQAWYNPERRYVFDGNGDDKAVGHSELFGRVPKRARTSLGYSSNLSSLAAAIPWPGNCSDHPTGRVVSQSRHPTRPLDDSQPFDFPTNWPLHKSTVLTGGNQPHRASTALCAPSGLQCSPSDSSTPPTYAQAVAGSPKSSFSNEPSLHGSSKGSPNASPPKQVSFKQPRQTEQKEEGSFALVPTTREETSPLQFAFDGDECHACFKTAGVYCRVCDNKPSVVVSSIFSDPAISKIVFSANPGRKLTRSSPISIPHSRDRSPRKRSSSRGRKCGSRSSSLDSVITQCNNKSSRDSSADFTVVGPGKHHRRRLREQQRREQRKQFPPGGSYADAAITRKGKTDSKGSKPKKTFPARKAVKVVKPLPRLSPIRPRPVILAQRSPTTVAARQAAAAALRSVSAKQKIDAIRKPAGECFCSTPISRQDPQRLLNWSFYLLSVVLILQNLPVANTVNITLPKGYYFSGTEKVFSWGNASTILDALNNVDQPSLPFRADYQNLTMSDYVTLLP